MTPRPAPITEDDLHAHVDGLLPPARAAEVEAWLAAHPDRAAEVALWQRQNEALNALFPPADAEPVPDRLQPRRLALRSRGVTLGWPQRAAAAVVLLAIGIGAGWALRELDRPSETAGLIASAVTAHALYVKENRHAVEVAAADRDHLVVPYTLDCNDARFATPSGFRTAEDFATYVIDAFDALHREGATTPRILNIGLHCRLIGRPGRIDGLRRALAHIAQHEDAWVTRRVDIARHWIAEHPPA